MIEIDALFPSSDPIEVHLYRTTHRIFSSPADVQVEDLERV
jgi:hypothetical protein